MIATVSSLRQASQVVDWANQTHLHWGGLVMALILAYAALVLPRRWVLLPLLILACFIPSGQRLVLATLDFTLLRLMVLVVWARILSRGDWQGLRLQRLDIAFLAWAALGTLAYTIRHGTLGALIFKLGTSFDALGLYFLFRCLIRDRGDLERVPLILGILAVPVCLAFLVERATGRNLFAVFGGVPAITEVREGRLRCQGAFTHSILAGCFWASSLPLVASQWWAGGRGRVLAMTGSLCAGTIVLLTASSTPLIAVFSAFLGGLAFLFRRFLSAGRLALFVTLVVLHFVMRGPVWSLLGRADVVGGSTGWHRFLLVDAAIKHFDEWCLLGTVSTAHWGRGLTDLTNQYVLEATQGGLGQLILFVLVLALGFRAAGMASRSAWPRRAEVALAWSLGVSLFTQAVSFLGVAYFGQIWILLFLVLACLSGMQALPPDERATRARAAREPNLLNA